MTTASNGPSYRFRKDGRPPADACPLRPSSSVVAASPRADVNDRLCSVRNVEATTRIELV